MGLAPGKSGGFNIKKKDRIPAEDQLFLKKKQARKQGTLLLP